MALFSLAATGVPGSVAPVTDGSSGVLANVIFGDASNALQHVEGVETVPRQLGVGRGKRRRVTVDARG